MPKTPPPYLRPPTVVPTTRTYAHVRAVDLACPACGAVVVIQAYRVRPPRRGPHRTQQAKERTGQERYSRAAVGHYNDLTGVWTCGTCERSWYLGVMLWPAGLSRGRPGDHIPTLEESGQVRLQLGLATTTRRERGGYVNLVCWCGQGCPAHPPEGDVID